MRQLENLKILNIQKSKRFLEYEIPENVVRATSDAFPQHWRRVIMEQQLELSK